MNSAHEEPFQDDFIKFRIRSSRQEPVQLRDKNLCYPREINLYDL